MAGSNLAKSDGDAESRRVAAFEAWKSFKEDVRDAYPIDRAIEDFTGERLQGRPGADRKGKCPFHNDNRPSMNVRPQHGYFKCHAAGCEAGGDIFRFISEYRGVSFKQAVLLAAERVGITPPGGAGAYTPVQDTGTRRPRPRFENRMNPAKLFESDLIPAFRGLRKPVEGQFFPVWHPGGGRTETPCLKRYRPEMVHVYRDMSSRPVLLVLRCRHRDNGKYFMPIRVGHLPGEAPDFVVGDKENRTGWLVKPPTPGHRKPIYGMEDAAAFIANGGRRILIIEGEKTRDAARQLISQLEDADDWLVLAPMGGHNTSLYADWTEFMEAIDQEALDTLTFSVWPDADHMKQRPDGTEIDAQALYVQDTIGAFVTAARKAGRDVSRTTFNRALPGTNRENGWDLDDAKNEGWTGEDVRRAIDEGGMEVAVEKRFLEMDVHLDESDPAPFEDGPEEFLELSDRDDAGAGDTGEIGEDAIGTDGGDEIPDAEIVSQTPPADASVEETLAVTRQFLAEAGDMPHEPVAERNLADDEIVEAGEDGEILDADDEGEDGMDSVQAARRNTHFRCLGYRDNTNYFMSLRSGQIFALHFAAMRKQALLSLAPKDFWATYFVEWGQNGRATIDWDDAVSELVQASYDAGVWDPKKEAGQGARVDGGRVVFNTGDRLWIQTEEDGRGVVDIAANFVGDYHYTVGESCGLPAFDDAFRAGDPEPRELLGILREINWREGSRNLSIMAMFGWLCIGPICGVLPWRPHLWLDGPRAAGKSWIIENIIYPCLGDYAIRVKSNSTEPGLRNLLHSKAFPLVFDEAEAEADQDRVRVAGILKLARHSAQPGNSIVAQGVAGGAGQRFFSINSTFLMSSITPQLEESADNTRFARAKLGPGHKFAKFSRKLEEPAARLLTPDFSARMIARMVTRASALPRVQRMMVLALTQIGLERRLADVWGTYAAGAWLLLEDGEPEDYHAAMDWIETNFGIGKEIHDFAEEVHEDKDHARLMRHIMAHEMRVETLHLGTRTLTVGALIDMALRDPEEEMEEEALAPEQAARKLSEIGIRLACNGKVAKNHETPDALLIHKNSPRIREMLKSTPYRAGYVDVIQQAGDVKSGPSVRFGGLGTYRSVIVPLEHFPLSDEEDDDGNQGEEGRR